MMALEGEFVEQAVKVIRNDLEWMRHHHRDEEEVWAASLRLEGASIENDELILRFTEPDGRRVNYRWRVRDEWSDALLNPDEGLASLSSNFHEDVECLDLSEPDAEGVRWFGDDT